MYLLPVSPACQLLYLVVYEQNYKTFVSAENRGPCHRRVAPWEAGRVLSKHLSSSGYISPQPCFSCLFAPFFPIYFLDYVSV